MPWTTLAGLAGGVMADDDLAPLRQRTKRAEGDRITLGSLQARALRRRELQEKEAFTIVDNAGDFFRASLKVLKKTGGEALVYERMTGSIDSPAEIPLLCAPMPTREPPRSAGAHRACLHSGGRVLHRGGPPRLSR